MSTDKIADLLERNKYAIISCADPRITPEHFLGLNFGEAAIIRNGGGRTADALRSILDLDSLGATGTVVVIHHTDCGMTYLSEEEFHDRVEKRHPDFAGSHPDFNYGAINDPEKTVVADVEYLKSFPTLAENMTIAGLVFDTFTGELKRMV
ncbi:carbonic anhydras-like protein [Hyaloscypha finlandica]|nr:carbonic anhydras-like protein [Hyaloscypha sp. PMI_1271]KAH8771299.1 carbonic anhydras-like protein [Hyaloscypha finlandica]